MSIHQIQWEWVKGHAGHRENEIADQLSQGAIKTFLRSLNLEIQPGLF